MYKNLIDQKYDAKPVEIKGYSVSPNNCSSLFLIIPQYTFLQLI